MEPPRDYKIGPVMNQKSVIVQNGRSRKENQEVSHS
jgi:hypothetical protein